MPHDTSNPGAHNGVVKIIPQKPGPGQESVWSYPRPPRVDPTTEHVTIRFRGATICDTNRPIRVLETSHPPTYYLPISDFAEGTLIPVTGSSFCEFKGSAQYFDVVGPDGKVAPRAAWTYPDPSAGFTDLREHVAVYAEAMDECLVNDERVQPQPGNFYGGWVTSRVVGPFKGGPGSAGW
jgi:uncharacterized protein (DUF427 family)